MAQHLIYCPLDKNLTETPHYFGEVANTLGISGFHCILMKIYRSFLLLYLFGFLSIASIFGQSLSLEEAIQKAKNNSPISKQVRSKFEAEQWRFKSNRAILKPQLAFSAQVPEFTRRINQVTQPDGSILFRPLSQNFSSGTLSLSQNLLATGGTLSLNSGLSRIDLFSVFRNCFFIIRCY